MNEPSAPSRPAVSIVMPFAGDVRDAASAVGALCTIERQDGDELIIVDNSPQPVMEAIRTGCEVRFLRASAERSSYYARNVGAAAASNDWLLFIDSDCVPERALVSRYFSGEIADHVGAIAGEIVGDESQAHVLARYQRDRGYLGQRRNLQDPRPYAVTANLLVRARAWRSVGGFLEGIRSGGDTDFTWRLQDAGWRLDYRPDAVVVHRHRETFRSFSRVTLRYAAGRGWLNRRYPGSAPAAPSEASALRALAGMLRWLSLGQPERARFRAIDALVIAVDRIGYAFANVSPQRRPPLRPDASVVVFADTFPEISETFIGSECRGLVRAGCTVRVEAARRAARQDLAAAREFAVDYREDDPPLRKLVSLVGLVLRHPRPCAVDLLARRRWRREESVPPLRVIAAPGRRLERHPGSHLHAHFAGGAALTAMRLARITGRPYSVTAHAYDIFREPRNLREKLERAAFVTTGCQYNIEHLRSVAPGAHLHEIVMGVDGDKFHRRTKHAAGRRVIAIGRLVEKKGFEHLVNAVAELERSAPIERLEIVGDGPLRTRLEQQVRRLGLGAKVLFLGVLEPDRVRDVIESADVLAMPCVVAGDGDRDSMPVVVKEALALEVPVVASDQVGLPELIDPAWGRLVPPGDSRALAEAIAAVLAMDMQERARMGSAGRAHVLAHCNVDTESERLAQLIRTYSTTMR